MNSFSNFINNDINSDKNSFLTFRDLVNDAKIEKINNQMRSLNNKSSLSFLEKSKVKFQNEIIDQINKIESLEKENLKLNTKIENLEKYNQILENNMNIGTENLLYETSKKYRLENEKIRNENILLNQSLINFESKIEKLSNKNSTYSRALELKADEFKEASKNMNLDIKASLLQDVGFQREKYINLKKKQKQLENSLKVLQSKNSILEDNNEKLMISNASCSSEIYELKNEIEQINDEKQSKLSIIEGLKKEIQILQDKNTNQNDKIKLVSEVYLKYENQKDENEILQKKIFDLEKDNNQQKNQIEIINSELNKKIEQIDKLQIHNKELDHEKINIKTEQDVLNEKQADLNELIEKNIQTISQLKSEKLIDETKHLEYETNKLNNHNQLLMNKETKSQQNFLKSNDNKITLLQNDNNNEKIKIKDNYLNKLNLDNFDNSSYIQDYKYENSKLISIDKSKRSQRSHNSDRKIEFDKRYISKSMIDQNSGRNQNRSIFNNENEKENNIEIKTVMSQEINSTNDTKEDDRNELKSVRTNNSKNDNCLNEKIDYIKSKSNDQKTNDEQIENLMSVLRKRLDDQK